MSGFLSELKRRNVIRMAGLYLVGAWLLVQVFESLLPVFGTPDWVLKTLILLLALGFVPTLVFSWVFELTPDGLKRDTQVVPGSSVAAQTATRMERMILLLLVLAVALFAVDRFALAPQRTASSSALAANFENPTDAASDSDGAAAQNSVAVLPFADMSRDRDQEYFSDGMTEELLNVLAKIPQLKVAARTSVFEFKGKGGDVREIGATLGVSHIVEGSVRRDAEQIRVTVQLIRVADGFHLWSETYDRELTGVFALQDDIARKVATQLQSRLVATQLPATRAAIDPIAYDEYLKGRALRRQREDLPQAIEHFKAAVSRSPGFAAAWSSMALTYEVSFWFPAERTPEYFASMMAGLESAAQTAADLEPEAAATVHALGNLARAQFKHALAETHYLRAMQIDPSYPDVREDYAELLIMVGRVRDSETATRQLIALDPYFVISWVRLWDIGVPNDSRADVELALRKLREIGPKIFVSKFGALDYAILRGRNDEARAAMSDVATRVSAAELASTRTLLSWALDRNATSAEALHAALSETSIARAAYYTIARQDLAAYNQLMATTGATNQGRYFTDLNMSQPMGHAMLGDPGVKPMLVKFGLVAYWREKGWPDICRPLGPDDFECGIAAEAR